MLDLVGKALTRNMLNNPIFVVGAGRSGTSILLQALGEHSRILSSDRESPFIPYVGYLLHPFELRDNRDYHVNMLNIPTAYLYKTLRRLAFESAMGRHYGLRLLTRRPAKILAGLRGKQHWCAKTYPNKTECEGLLRLYPGARILYIFRNGYDVVQSRSRFREMSKLSFSEQCQTWASHVEKYQYLLEVQHATPVRHEEIVTNPDAAFRKILGFIGLDYEPGPTNFSNSTLIHSQGQKTRTNVDVAQSLRTRPPAYESWDDEQKAVFKEICTPGMLSLGYEIPF